MNRITTIVMLVLFSPAVVAVAEAPEEWNSLDAAGLRDLAVSLAKEGDSAKKTRGQLATYVAQKFFFDAETVKSVGIHNWLFLAGHLHREIAQEQRIQWVAELSEAFADNDQAVLALNGTQARELSEAFGFLGDVTSAETVSWAWLQGKRAVWPQTGVFDLASMARFVGMVCEHDKTRKAQAVPLMNEVGQSLMTRKLNETACRNMIKAWWAVGDKAKMQAWGNKAYETALGTEKSRAAMTAADMVKLAQNLKRAGLTGKGKGFDTYAAVLARLAKESKLPHDLNWTVYRYLSRPLGTDETRKLVEEELIDARGQVSLGAAKVLAWAYRDTGDTKAWRAILDGKLSAVGLAGDTKARLLLARAYAEYAIRRKSFTLRGKQWLNQALEIAQSDFVRIVAIKQLVHSYASSRRYVEGTEFLDSAAKQFTDAQIVEVIQSLRTELWHGELKYLRKEIAVTCILAGKLEDLVAQAQDEERKNFFLKWSNYDRMKEQKLRRRLEQMEQTEQ